MRLRRGRAGGLVLLAALAVLGLLAARFALDRPLPTGGEEPHGGYARAKGVVHVHTTLSDGGGTPQEVIRAARAARLDFVGITDHNVVDAKPLEAYHGGVLVLVGSELSTTAGHILGLGLAEDPVYRFSGDGLDGLLDVRDLGGLAFAAHPLSARADLRFSGWELPGPWGIELLNGDSEWRRAGPRLLLTVGLYRLNARRALLASLGSPREVLERWDAILARRDAVGITGSDAHSRLPLTKRRALRFPSYEALFGLASNHLLLDAPLRGEAESDRRAVLEAFHRGRLYVGLDAIAPAGGVSFTIEGGGRRWTMGESVRVGEGGVAVASLTARVSGRMPSGARVSLIRDGRVVREAPGPLAAPLPGPGVYRVEIRAPGQPDQPWVLTNPVSVFDGETLAARARAAEWPAEPPPPAAFAPLESLPGSPAFNPEHDPSSWVDPGVVEPGGGPAASPAMRLAFRLAPPGPERPFTWCALVNRQARDLTGWDGLRFRIRGNGVYRVWVQVRDVNPASADDGLEWWLASARTDTGWREVRLPFARFRTINKRTDGRLDRDAVRALVFVLDHAAVKPGTEGTIRISDLGVYR